MPIKPILLLGNTDLYKISQELTADELPVIAAVVTDLHDTMMDFRRRYGCGRAIAAPQIGVFKRLVYLHIDKPQVYINPILHDPSSEMIELWDDCMSFPEILVRLRRHRTIRINYRDPDWVEHDELLEGDMSELLQHEVDHLDGILAIKRAINHQSFALKSQRGLLKGKPR
jgi:peptide deformylase